MATRRSPAQIRSQLRQAQSRARQNQQKLNQAVRDYNRQVDKTNAARRKFVSDYNSAARKYNRSVDAFNREQKRRAAVARSNRTRLEQELRRLERAPATRQVRVEFRSSVEALAVSASRLEGSTFGSLAGGDVVDLSEGEAANSVASLAALLSDDTSDDRADPLQQSHLTAVLGELDPEIGDRWSGALFALSPVNPDAARHFCTSAREMLSDVLERLAPSEEVERHDPACHRTPNGDVSRRARIHYCLGRAEIADEEFENFVEDDIENVLALFHEFNSATHGRAGKFTLRQLGALKQRVEDAIFFVMRLGAGPTA
jgi:hypothetical protein